MIAKLACHACVGLLLVVACDGGSEESGGSDDGSDAATCEDETRDDTYVVGLSRTGEHVMVRFVDAMPTPPDRGDNTWIVEVLDAGTQTPLGEVDLAVEPFMPDHMHGTSIACQVTAMPTAGQFELSPVNLFMPGLWEVRLDVTLDEGASDRIVFSFCVDP